MTTDIVLYWLPFIACVSIVVFGAYYAWKALYADRAKGRRRCPRCWYDMAYSEGLTCSECGYAAQDEQQLSHTRRRYTRAAAGILVSVITILGVYLQVTSQNRGILSVMPSGVLIMAMPLVNDSGSDVFKHLSRRMFMDELSVKQRERIIRRCVIGDWMVDPPDDDWVDKYGAFLDPIRQSLIADRRGDDLVELEKPLLDVPAKIYFDARATWPTGTRARVRVRARDWWPTGYEMRLRITPEANPEDERVIIQRPNRFGSRAFVLYTDPLDESVTSVAYDVEVSRRRADLDEPDWDIVSTETITLPLAVSETVETAIDPVEGAELITAMKRVFGNVTRWPGGPQPVRFWVNRTPTMSEPFNDMAIGVSVELLRDGEVARQLDLWWLAGEDVQRSRYDHEVPFEDVETLLSITPEELNEHWKLRVRSDPIIAMRAGEAPTYWKGEFTIDIGLLQLNDTPANPKPPNWWVEEDEAAAGGIAQ